MRSPPIESHTVAVKERALGCPLVSFSLEGRSRLVIAFTLYGME